MGIFKLVAWEVTRGGRLILKGAMCSFLVSSIDWARQRVKRKS